MKRLSFSTTALAAVLVMGLSACQQTGQKEEAPDNVNEFKQPTEAPVERAAPPMATDLGTVYFDFDSSRIRTDARDVLKKNAEALRSSGNAVTIEGHCDERGDEEYNMGLGQRRADTVAGYLRKRGLGRDRVETSSRGEMDAKGTDDASWSEDRKVEIFLAE